MSSEKNDAKNRSRVLRDFFLSKNDIERLTSFFDQVGLIPLLDGTELIVKSSSGSLLNDAILLVKRDDEEKQKDSPHNPSNLRNSHNWKMSISSNKIKLFYENMLLHEVEVTFSSPTRRNNGMTDLLITYCSLLRKQESLIGAEEIALLYGTSSPLYFLAIKTIHSVLDKNFELHQEMANNWKNLLSFELEDITKEKQADSSDLFIKQLYFVTILLLIIAHATASCQEDECVQKVQMTIKELEEKRIPIFSDIFTVKFLRIWIDTASDLINLLGTPLHGRCLKSEDLFRELYLQLIPIDKRQTLGEFYTPPMLARLMVENSYRPGMNVLDPACGSGTFLVEILIQLFRQNEVTLDGTDVEKSIIGLHGYDLHPLAVFTTRVNLFLITYLRRMQISLKFLRKMILNIQKVNFLQLVDRFEVKNASRELKKFDLIIGNPPWIVLNGINNLHFKMLLKKLARKMDVLPPPHQVSNLEVSALFFYGSKYLLKENGIVFMVVSNAFLTGDNHSRTRQFIDFVDIEAWKFNTDLFRIHSICLKARYSLRANKTLQDLENLEVLVKYFEVSIQRGEMMLTQTIQEIHVPYSVEKEGRDHHDTKARYHVRKLIPRHKKSSLLPLGKSPYHEKCYNGAVLGPRNLIFVKVLKTMEEKNGVPQLAVIQPIVENPKKPWDFNPLEELGTNEIVVERRYIYQALRSVNLVPFLALRFDHVFLPIEEDPRGGYRFLTNQDSMAYHYFCQLDQLYQKYKKKTQSLETLWKNINYQNKLIAARQRSPFKVVIQGSGTIVKAAVVTDPRVIIDSTNYLIACSSSYEAYYLAAILNAPILTETIRLIQAEGAGGGGRHIQKRPFTVNIPKFDSDDDLHCRLAKFSHTMTQKLQTFAQSNTTSARKSMIAVKPMTLQRSIFKKFQREFLLLDALVKRLFQA